MMGTGGSGAQDDWSGRQATRVRCIINRHHGKRRQSVNPQQRWWWATNGGQRAVWRGASSAQWDQCIMPFGGIVEHCPPRSDKRIVCSSCARHPEAVGGRRGGVRTTRVRVSIDCRVSPRAREAPSEYYSAVVETHHVVAAARAAGTSQSDLAERRQHRRGVERAGCCIDAAWSAAAAAAAGKGGRKSAIEGVVCVMAAPTFC